MSKTFDSLLRCGHVRGISSDQALGVWSGAVNHSVYCRQCDEIVPVEGLTKTGSRDYLSESIK